MGALGEGRGCFVPDWLGGRTFATFMATLENGDTLALAEEAERLVSQAVERVKAAGRIEDRELAGLYSARLRLRALVGELRLERSEPT